MTVKAQVVWPNSTVRAGDRQLVEVRIFTPEEADKLIPIFQTDNRLDKTPPPTMHLAQRTRDGYYPYYFPVNLTQSGKPCAPGSYSLMLRLEIPSTKQCLEGRVLFGVSQGDNSTTVNITVSEEALANFHNVNLGSEQDNGPVVLDMELGDAVARGPQKNERPIPPPGERRTRAILEEVSSGGEKLLRHIDLVSRPNVQFGRTPEKAQIPIAEIEIINGMYEESDEVRRKLGCCISRLHFRLEATTDGLFCVAEKGASLGVFLGENHIGPGNHVQITKEQIDASFQIDAGGLIGLTFTSTRDAWDKSDNLRQTYFSFWDEQTQVRVSDKPNSTWNLAKALGLDALRMQFVRDYPIQRRLEQFERIFRFPPSQSPRAIVKANHGRLQDGWADRREAILLLRSATIGGGMNDAVHVSGMDSSLARITYLAGVYWLERLDHESLVSVEGYQLNPLEVIPLHDGDKIVLEDHSSDETRESHWNFRVAGISNPSSEENK